jgi:hypothetical protein
MIMQDKIITELMKMWEVQRFGSETALMKKLSRD